jgi:hypothetical protein
MALLQNCGSKIGGIWPYILPRFPGVQWFCLWLFGLLHVAKYNFPFADWGDKLVGRLANRLSNDLWDSQPSGCLDGAHTWFAVGTSSGDELFLLQPGLRLFLLSFVSLSWYINYHSYQYYQLSVWSAWSSFSALDIVTLYHNYVHQSHCLLFLHWKQGVRGTW